MSTSTGWTLRLRCAPAEMLDGYTGMRYVWRQDGYTVVLTIRLV